MGHEYTIFYFSDIVYQIYQIYDFCIHKMDWYDKIYHLTSCQWPDNRMNINCHMCVIVRYSLIGCSVEIEIW